MKLRVVFAGTPVFAVPSLRALVDAGHDVVAVYTQPDRPAGRGRRVQSSAVKQQAIQLGLPVRQPERLAGEADHLAALAPDVMVVVAYGLILPAAILAVPRLGCVNVHASLLPRWRGAAPVARAIEAGDPESGVTLMQMDAGMDTGAILRTAAEALRSDDTAATLHDRLAELGARILVDALPALARGEIEAQPQDNRLASHAPKLSAAEAWIDWGESAEALDRRIRAFVPWPVARTAFGGETLKVWAAVPVAGGDDGENSDPGVVRKVDAEGIVVGCGQDSLRLTRVQRAGARALDATEFARGARIEPGTRFGAGADAVAVTR